MNLNDGELRDCPVCGMEIAIAPLLSISALSVTCSCGAVLSIEEEEFHLEDGSIEVAVWLERSCDTPKPHNPR